MKSQGFYTSKFKDLMELNGNNIAPEDIHPDVHIGKNVELGRHVVIDRECVIGNNVTVGHGTVILQGCIIKDDVQIGHNVVLEPFTEVGKGCILDSHVLSSGYNQIGDGCKVGAYTKIGKRVIIGKNCCFTCFCEIRDRCVLGNNVTMGSRCTLSAGVVVEDDVIMKYGFVATDTLVVGQAEKSVGVLKKGSRFGVNVVVMPGINIGENSEIGACSQVRHDVPDNEVWYGNPASFFREVSE